MLIDKISQKFMCILFSIMIIICTSCSGNEYDSTDLDMDGIDAYDDVDDVISSFLYSDIAFNTITPTLNLLTMNPERVTKYWIQLSHSDDQFEDFIFFSKDDYETNWCTIPSGILYDGTFQWRAKAWDNIEKRWSNSWSNVYRCTVETGGIGFFPTNRSSIADSTPLFNWPDIPGAVKYNFKSGNITIENLTESEYQMTDILSNGYEGSWKIRHQNDNGIWSPWSDLYFFKIWVPAPTSLNPINEGQAKIPKAFLDWEDIDDIGAYRVSVYDNLLQLPIIDEIVTESYYKVDIRLEYNQNYYWKVRSQNTDGVWGTDVNEKEWQFTIGTIAVSENIINSNYDSPLGAHIADLDDDGDADIITAEFFNNTVSWWKNDGAGSFTEHNIDTDFDGGGRAFDAVDIDKDGDIDIIGGSYYGDKLVWWENDGAENFNKHIISDTFDGAWQLAAADFNGDGEIDIVGSASSGGIFILWENNGAEKFTQHTLGSKFMTPKGLDIADIDNDGDLDIFGATYASNSIIWWKNNGAGIFSEIVIDSDFKFASSVLILDLNNDGYADITGASKDNNEISWWENNGSETFTKHLLSSSMSPSYIQIEDLNLDDYPDIFVGDGDVNKIFWFENDGSGTFAQRMLYKNTSYPTFISSSDFDGDGDPDILELLSCIDNILWLENDALD
ncbi:MAG: VCBS repeat-containing protein [Spirochaetales bacterium]|nr:VCBS repeat-containing protein [Spirochaetales bacterium]